MSFILGMIVGVALVVFGFIVGYLLAVAGGGPEDEDWGE